MCGFENGNVRIFDMKNYCVTKEIDFHKNKVQAIDISAQDKLILTAE